jgi:hypothetical protein
MKKTLVSLILMILVAAACTPQAPTEPPSIIINDPVRPTAVKPTPTNASADLTPAQQAAVSALAESVGLPIDQITLVSTEAVTWPDGCLGVHLPNVMCTEALVDGFKIILEADGDQYEFHTNQDGSAIVLATGAPTSLGSVEDAVIKELANNLGLDEKDIIVVSSTETEFSDACLGVSMPEVMCAQVITPGRIIVLEANGVQYEYHTNADGSHTVPATLALTWKREGGIAGFCDNLTVFLSGEVYGNQCRTGDGRMDTFASLLSSSERNNFQSWVEQYGELNIDASDPKGVSDRMVVTLTFLGTGDEETVSSPDQRALLEFAQSLYQKLYQ